MKVLANSVRVIREKLADVSARIKELQKLDLSDPSYQSQERRAELRHLLGEKQYDEDRIERKPVDREAQARTRAAIEFATQEAVENKLAFIARLEAQGEWSQAKIHRIDLQRIRERMETFYGG